MPSVPAVAVPCNGCVSIVSDEGSGLSIAPERIGMVECVPADTLADWSKEFMKS